MVKCQCQECKTIFEYDYRISICESCLLKHGMMVEDIFNKGMAEGRKQPLSKIRFKMEQLVFAVPQPTALKEKFNQTWEEIEKEYLH